MRRRQLIWGIAAVAIIALVLLSAGLGQLDLFPEERPFTLRALLLWMWEQYKGSIQEIEPLLPGSSEAVILLLRIAFALALILLPVSIVFFLVSPEFRKKALRELARIMVLMLTIFALSRTPLLEDAQLPEPEMEAPAADIDFDTLLETDFAYEQEPSRWIIYAVSLLIALVVAFFLVRLGWRLLREREENSEPMQRLAREARIAVDALKSDADIRDVVTRCYAEMSRVVQEERDLKRDTGVTAREFERYLGQRGLPIAPVRTLTRLFESVRYGDKMPGEVDRQQAIESLSAIAEACRSAA